MHRIKRAALVIVAVIAVAGCSSDEKPRPRTGADLTTAIPPSRDHGAIRLFEAGPRVGNFTTKVRVTHAKPEMLIRFDCVGGKGGVRVRVGDSAGSVDDCDVLSKSHIGSIRMGGTELSKTTTVKVSTKDPETRWVAAVDLYDEINHDE